ncbi:hypothetical protein SLE2022_032870 [Rubroshorea leprosula]
MKLRKENWITLISGKTERQPGIGTRRLKTRRIVWSRRNCITLVIARVWIRRIFRDNRVKAARSTKSCGFRDEETENPERLGGFR